MTLKSKIVDILAGWTDALLSWFIGEEDTYQDGS